MKHVGPLALLLFAIGCTSQVQDEVARSAAKEAINPVLAQQFPGLPLNGVADCLIDNATAQEIATLAASSATGPTTATADLVGQIAARPETVRCLFEQGAVSNLAGELAV